MTVSVRKDSDSDGRMDVYIKGSFVMEARHREEL